SPFSAGPTLAFILLPPNPFFRPSMNLTKVVNLGLAAGAAMAAGRQCGTEAPTEENFRIAKMIAERIGTQRVASLASAEPINVDIYAHVVSGANNSYAGWISNDTVHEQVKVLNEDYNKTGFSFTLKDVDWTINTTWTVNSEPMEMKRALRKGSYKDLNIYFLANIDGNLGYSYYPTAVEKGSNDFYRDGCVILASSTPGGRLTNYNMGKTATHEVGHWFGLFHTFNGGCSDVDGDYVSDTPAQMNGTEGCPASRDSCPDKEGLDPIHNYMDYSYDSCMEEFTEGQIQRMRTYWEQFRADAE
ncbi:hypothetical protein jhhlp_006829, partial [Lomentospora prolificans]